MKCDFLPAVTPPTAPGRYVPDYHVPILPFQFSKDYGLNYLVWRVWIGMWIVVICTLVVAFEGCFLVKYFTRFTEEIFASLISFIFVYEALKFLYEVRKSGIFKYKYLSRLCPGLPF